MKAWLAKLSTRQKVLLGAALYLGTTILLLGVAGSEGKNDEFKPQNEFKLDTWISIHIGPLDMTHQQGRALPVPRLRRSRSSTMVYIAKRMQAQAEPRADRGRGRLRR